MRRLLLLAMAVSIVFIQAAVGAPTASADSAGHGFMGTAVGGRVNIYTASVPAGTFVYAYVAAGLSAAASGSDVYGRWVCNDASQAKIYADSGATSFYFTGHMANAVLMPSTAQRSCGFEVGGWTGTLNVTLSTFYTQGDPAYAPPTAVPYGSASPSPAETPCVVAEPSGFIGPPAPCASPSPICFSPVASGFIGPPAPTACPTPYPTGNPNVFTGSCTVDSGGAARTHPISCVPLVHSMTAGTTWTVSGTVVVSGVNGDGTGGSFGPKDGGTFFPSWDVAAAILSPGTYGFGPSGSHTEVDAFTTFGQVTNWGCCPTTANSVTFIVVLTVTGGTDLASPNPSGSPDQLPTLCVGPNINGTAGYICGGAWAGCSPGPLSNEVKVGMVCTDALPVCAPPSDGFDVPGWLGFIACEIGSLPTVIHNAIAWVINALIDLLVPGTRFAVAIHRLSIDWGSHAPMSYAGDAIGIIQGGLESPSGASMQTSVTLMGVAISLPWSTIAGYGAGIRGWLVPVVYLGGAFAVLRIVLGLVGGKGPESGQGSE